MSWTADAAHQLDEIRAQNRWRQVRALDAKGPHGTLGSKPVVSFASNDYLGLTSHPAVIAAAHEALDRWGTGAGAARLIVGNRPVHDELEAELAAWRHTERAVIFPTGFMANLGALSVFGGPDVTVLSDELNHASIIDGCRLSRSRVQVYRHSDIDHCAALLNDARLNDAEGRRIVVTDAVFSMDGDVAPLTELAELCAATDALLVIDEAHSVLGPDFGADCPAELLRIGTLSKTLGSLGGYVAAARPLVELLVNRARPFIFTTGGTPADTAAALAAVRVVRSDEGRELCERLRGHVERVRAGHPSPIIPIVLGDENVTLAAADALLAQGVLVPAIRPPTVPVGTSRLRIALSAAHTSEDIGRLLTQIAAHLPPHLSATPDQ